MTTKPKRKLDAYPLRVCRYLNHCCVCDNDIVAGEDYYDGGYGRRAHAMCAVDAKAREIEKESSRG